MMIMPSMTLLVIRYRPDMKKMVVRIPKATTASKANKLRKPMEKPIMPILPINAVKRTQMANGTKDRTKTKPRILTKRTLLLIGNAK